MSEDGFLTRQRRTASAEKPTQAAPYTTKDFQLEVLGKLAEMQGLSESLQQSWSNDLKGIREQRLLKFDSRTMVALLAIGLSVAGYVIQDARNTAKQDSELESTKARVLRLEQIAAANTEGRIKTEVQLGELREGQAEIKALIQAHDNASKKAIQHK